MSAVSVAVRLVATLGVAGVVAGLAGCSSEDALTGTGQYEESPEKISELVAGAEAGQGQVYCETKSGEMKLASWLRGPDDFVVVADDRLGLARDPGAVTFWDRDQAVALEVLTEELGMMGLDLEGVSSQAVFGGFVTGAGGAAEDEKPRCRPLDDAVYPDLEGVQVYTMLDVESGTMTETQVEALFSSFEQY